MRINRKISICIPIIVGALIWALSPVFTGQLEPWDASLAFLPIWLAVVSLLLGYLFPKNALGSSIGLFIGQLAYAAFVLPLGPLVLIGVAILFGHVLVFSLPFTFLGAWLKGKWKPEDQMMKA